MRSRVIISVGTLGMLAGCSLLTDLSGLSDGTPANGEAGVEAASDAPSESDAGDAGDAGPRADAAGCSRYADASFCVDFEGPDPISVGTWSELGDIADPQPKRTITLTQQDPISPPNAVVFDLAGGGTDCEYVRLIKRFTGEWTSITTRFDQRAETASIFFTESFRVSGQLSFSVLVALGAGNVRLFVQKNDGFVVTEVGAIDVPTVPPVVGRWASFALELRTTPTKTATLIIDGKALAPLALPAELVARDPEVAFGPHCAGAHARATIDDVAVFFGP